MNHQESILQIMRGAEGPVFDALYLAKVITHSYLLTTNDIEYRRILRTLHKMEAAGLVGSELFWGSNQRVWWLTERIRPLNEIQALHRGRGTARR